MAHLTAGEIAALVGGELEGDANLPIGGVATLESAGSGELSFVANARYLPYLQGTRAGALLVGAELAAEVPPGRTRITVDDPHQALYRVLLALHPPRQPEAEVHATAVVHPTAEVHPEAAVGPYAVIEAGARVGAGTRIGPHVVVGEGAEIGRHCTVHAHATLYPGVVMGDRCLIHSGARLGREGFGFVWLDGGHRRVPQVGHCVLGDDVEVGANSTIDRGSVGDTVVGSGTKLDNLVHLGHNVRVGEHVMMIAQVGVAGSTQVGDGAVLGGQVGVAGHLSIGAGARLGAQAGVIGDIPAGETYSGYPARPHREALRAQGALFRLPELLKRVRALERRLFGDHE